MSDTVVSLWGQPVGVREPSPALVQELERLLEAARSGEIIGGGFVLLHADATASWVMAGRMGGFSVLGALEMVRAELIETNRG
jgi:hypothetical protein